MNDGSAAARAVLPTGGLLIEARGIVKDFHDAGREIHVLRDLDLTVRAGEEIAIVGQSGVGKSTLLYVLGIMVFSSASKSASK